MWVLSDDRFDRMGVAIEFLDLVFVLSFNNAALELQSWRDLAGCNRKFVRNNEDLLDGLEMRQPFVEVFNNSGIELAHLAGVYQLCMRIEGYSVSPGPV